MKYTIKIMVSIVAAFNFGLWQHSVDAGLFMLLLLILYSIATE